MKRRVKTSYQILRTISIVFNGSKSLLVTHLCLVVFGVIQK
jgi:hypothetical protein